ncbi:MAG: hypothetical protein ACRDPT_08250, partial [Streptomycetales bacterium]
MSSSGLIYAVIVGAWAAYLVPMWLRRNDELRDFRELTADQMPGATRVLSRRTRGAPEPCPGSTPDRDRAPMT